MSVLGSSSGKMIILPIFVGNIYVKSPDEPDEVDEFDDFHFGICEETWRGSVRGGFFLYYNSLA